MKDNSLTKVSFHLKYIILLYIEVVKGNNSIYSSIFRKETAMVIENLCKIMNEKGITAYKIEKDIGIKQTTFNSWKKGAQPTADKLEKIIRYIGVSADEIFFGEKESFTSDEIELIEKYRLLEANDKFEIKGIMKLKLQKLPPDRDEAEPQEEKLSC